MEEYNTININNQKRSHDIIIYIYIYIYLRETSINKRSKIKENN